MVSKRVLKLTGFLALLIWMGLILSGCWGPMAPLAAFIASPLSGVVPLAVQFTDQSTGNITAWEWDVDGNGTVDYTVQNPSHTYNAPGVYTVTLTVRYYDLSSSTVTKSNYITAIGIADLSVTKGGNPGAVAYGLNNVTYTVTVTNGGPHNAAGVTLTDTLPAAMTFVSATPSQGSCSGTTTVTCNLGAIANGANATVTIVVQAKAAGIDLVVDDDAGTCAYAGTMTDTATVTATEHDPNLANNTASTNTTINANHNTIQAAINGAAAGNVIFVCPGTYSESLTINKSITLTGDRGDVNTAGPGPNAPILDGSTLGAYKSAVSIGQGVSNVIIEGFEIRNYGPTPWPSPCHTSENGVVAWNSGTSNVTIRDNYMHHLGYSGVLTGNGWGSAQGLHDNWQITYNKVSSVCAYGFDIENAKNFTVNYNEIANIPSYNISITALATEAGANITSENIEVRHNTITGGLDRNINLLAWNSGGAAATLKNVVVTDNAVTGVFNLVIAWKMGTGATLQDLTIDNNTLTINNPKAAGYAVDLADVAGASSFSGNTLTLTGAVGGGGTFFHGVDVKGASTGAWTIANNRLDGNNVGANSVGIRLRNSLPASVVLNITGNTITEFANGIQSDALAAGATVEVHSNNITGNSVNGVLNGAGAMIDAENNWWGNASGPNDPNGTNEVPPCTADPTTEKNADGTGDKVSDNVDYCPWAAAAF